AIALRASWAGFSTMTMFWLKRSPCARLSRAMFGAPISHRFQNRLQRQSIFCQGVINARRHLPKHLTANNSVSFQFAQLLGQHLLGDVRNVTLKLAKPTHAKFVDVVQDYRFPLSRNDVHGGSHTTILFVEYFHGYQKAPTTIFESTPLSNTGNCRSDRLKQMASEVFRACSVMTWNRKSNQNEGEDPCQSSSLRVHQDSPGMQRSN